MFDTRSVLSHTPHTPTIDMICAPPNNHSSLELRDEASERASANQSALVVGCTQFKQPPPPPPRPSGRRRQTRRWWLFYAIAAASGGGGGLGSSRLIPRDALDSRPRQNCIVDLCSCVQMCSLLCVCGCRHKGRARRVSR